MYAQSAPEVGPFVLALPLVLLVALLLLGAWNVWLNARLRDLVKGLEQLRQARSFEDELRDVVRKRMAERFDAHSPADLAALDDALRSRLPGLIKAELESPSAALQGALKERLARVAEERLPDALAGVEARLVHALRDRLQALLEGGDDGLWEAIDEKLAEHAGRLVDQLDASKEQRLEARVGELLVRRIEQIFAAPDDFDGWFEDIDFKLGGRIVSRAEDPGADCARAMNHRIEVALQARLKTICDNPFDHDALFDRVDDRLCERVRARVDTLASTPGTAEQARLDGLVAEQLFARVERIFDNPDEHEGLFESVDEKLHERVLRTVNAPPEDAGLVMDQTIRDRLAGHVGHLFDQPHDHWDIFETIDEEIGQRVDRRLREELARGPDGLIELAMAEALGRRVRQRLEEKGRRESLDLVIDARIAPATASGPSEGSA